MFKTRLLFSLLFAPVMLGLIYVGGWVYFAAIAILMVVATAEYANLMKHLGWQTPVWLLSTAVFLLLLTAQLKQPNLTNLLLTFSIIATLLYALWVYEKNKTTNATADFLASLGGVILLGWLGMHFILIRHLDTHGERTMLIFTIIWSADSFAYLVGSQIGRHKLVPRLSPKKSVEGYLGGIFFSILIVLILSYALFPSLPLWPSALLALTLSLIAPAGDIAISMFKRESSVKDTGHIFPGHGGVLDRFDALLWGVAIGYYLILFFPN
ncbi:MAG: phosphatidate cytidylyltransferase [Anaerolineales bacterium]|nr:phosphatidate cytidylyltransferase [Anaerolineales bacterium]